MHVESIVLLSFEESRLAAFFWFAPAPPLCQALLHSSHLYHEATHNMASHGISVGDVSMDVSKMMENKDSKVEGLTGGIEYLCKKYKVRDHVVGNVRSQLLLSPVPSFHPRYSNSPPRT